MFQQDDEEISTNMFDATDLESVSNIPIVSSDANFVNMLRYSMLAISLLPEISFSREYKTLYNTENNSK